MNSHKQTKRALLTSVMALVMCVVMLVGTTFAWFTDTASTSVNKIEAGKLDVALEMEDRTSTTGWTNAEGKTLEFQKAAGASANEKVLWEPGCTYELPKLRIVNNGNLAIKYKVAITGIKGSDKLNEVIDWTIGDIGSTNAYTSLAVGASKEFTISGTMKTSANNDYQGLSIDGIGITVYATQDTVEYDSNGDQYDAKAGEDTAFYSLAEFNALTEIPTGIKNVYVTIGSVSLKDGSVVIGNDNIRDKYERKDAAGATGETTYTDKAGINLFIVGGTIKDGPAVDHAAANKIAFRIPDKSTVTFQGVKIEGFFGLSGATSDNPYGSVMPHQIESVIFDGCTFDALWLQDGSFGTKQITIKNSTFNKHENSVSASNTNPLWFKSIGQTTKIGNEIWKLYTNVSIDNCVFNTNRPVKVVEQDVNGQTVSITNCTFNMENDAGNKSAAIMFSDINGTLGNVVVSGNEVKGGVALLAFYSNPAQITMANGATFKVSDNTLNGAKLSVKWKTADLYVPDFMQQQ